MQRFLLWRPLVNENAAESGFIGLSSLIRINKYIYLSAFCNFKCTFMQILINK